VRLREESAIKQSDAEFVISSETRNLDVSRAFDMTNERKKWLLHRAYTEHVRSSRCGLCELLAMTDERPGQRGG
jgi:hypothetical protein